MKNKKPIKIVVNALITQTGIDIMVNNDKFSIIYPKKIWNSYDNISKQILKDNIALSATIFLPQILKLNNIAYKTARPIAETFLFENGIKDMPCCALSDGKSSLDYIKNFFNTHYIFLDNNIKTPKFINLQNTKKKKKTAIIPFSFGKESALSVNLCIELGIRPILVNFIEPSNEYEHFHKKSLIKKFETETGIEIYIVEYNPGLMRYGKFWGLKTELGWGLQTTEYSLLTLPLVSYFDADYIVLGNEQSCNDTFLSQEGILTSKAGYDQHGEWTKQQGLLSSLLLGKKIEVISFLEPLYEIAINKILHNRYPHFSKFQMSCMADNSNAKYNRWCQKCIKCGYIYALCCAFNLDLNEIGFTKNLFEKDSAKIYNHFFDYDPKNPRYGSQEELGLAFHMAYLNGCKGASIEKFKKEMLPKFKKNKKQLIKKYLGINKTSNIPPELKERLLKIYAEELKNI